MGDYEIHIFGLHSDDVTLKEEYEDEYGANENGGVEELFYDKVHCSGEFAPLEGIGTGETDGGYYIGMLAVPTYPWEKPNTPFRTKEEVVQAIVKAVSPYVVETPDEIRSKIREHDDFGFES